MISTLDPIDLGPAARSAERLAPLPAETRTARPAPGLTVLVGAVETLPMAGYLLRHGSALTLVPTTPDEFAVSAAMGGVAFPARDQTEARRAAALERAAAATADAGFDVHAVETVVATGLTPRLRSLADEDAACVVAATSSPRTVCRLARAAQAPVLALPRRAAAAGGPAVLAAGDAERVLPAVARALATEHAALVAGYTPVPADTLVRTAAHPVVSRRLTAMTDELRFQELDDAWWRADMAAEAADEHGLVPTVVVTPEPGAVLAAARARQGIAVVADPGGWRAPALLRAALRERRPALLVPVEG